MCLGLPCSSFSSARADTSFLQAFGALHLLPGCTLHSQRRRWSCSAATIPASSKLARVGASSSASAFSARSQAWGQFQAIRARQLSVCHSTSGNHRVSCCSICFLFVDLFEVSNRWYNHPISSFLFVNIAVF